MFCICYIGGDWAYLYFRASTSDQWEVVCCFPANDPEFDLCERLR